MFSFSRNKITIFYDSIDGSEVTSLGMACLCLILMKFRAIGYDCISGVGGGSSLNFLAFLAY